LGSTVPVSDTVVNPADVAFVVVANGGASSYAPMSQAAPRGRDTPRSSVGAQSAPASRALLPDRTASVSTGPPLSPSGPSSTGTPCWSVGPTNPQSLPSERSWPSVSTVPSQSLTAVTDCSGG